MISAEVVLRNPLGLHLRPAGVLCTEALKYASSVIIRYEDTVVNAKSVLGVLATGLRYGSRFEIICDGTDEEEALQKVKELIEQGLGEDIGDKELET